MLCLGVGGGAMLAILCDLMDTDSHAVQINVLMAKKEVVRRRLRESKITLKRTIAVRQIQLNYGFFGNLVDIFLMDYMCGLLD